MSLLPRWISYDSDKNGKVVAFEWRGQWRVDALSTQQSGPEMAEVWRQTFAAFRAKLGVSQSSRVLLLGLGTGSAVPVIYQEIQNVQIVAVEHDSVMVSLAKELDMCAPYPFPQILEMDALQALKRLHPNNVFDLVLIDLFAGETVSPVVQKPDFASGVKHILAKDGSVIANTFKTPEAYEEFSKVFPVVEIERAADNWVKLFRL